MKNEKIIYTVLRTGVKYILAATVAGALIAFFLAQFVIDKKYTAKSVVCININDTYAADYSELELSIEFADSYVAYLNHDFIRSEISKRFRNKYTVEELAEMIDVRKIDASQMLEISCTASTPEEAASICAVIPEVASQKIYELSQIGSTLVLEVTSQDSYPNVPLVSAMGAVVGLISSFVILYLLKRFFGRVDIVTELNAISEFQILGRIPLLNMDVGSEVEIE